MLYDPIINKTSFLAVLNIFISFLYLGLIKAIISHHFPSNLLVKKSWGQILWYDTNQGQNTKLVNWGLVT